MAGASCLYCELGRTGLKWTIGRTHEPLGTCRNCYSFACGHHGQRDHNVPEYMCVECVAPKLAASAVSWVEGDAVEDKDTADLFLALRTLYRPPIPLFVQYERGEVQLTNVNWMYASFEDFLRRSPGFGEEGLYGMEQHEDYSLLERYASLREQLSWQVRQQQYLFRKLENKGLDLLLAAVAVIDVLNIPEERIPRPLRELRWMLT